MVRFRAIHSFMLFCLCLVLLSAAPPQGQRTPSSSAPDAAAGELPAILLRARTIHPVRGIDTATEPDLLATQAAAAAREADFHALVQLDHIPDRHEKAALRAKGIDLQTYIPRLAWVARIDPHRVGPLGSLLDAGTVAWIGALLPTDKLSPTLAAQLTTPAEVDAPATVVNVQFHPDVDLEAGRALLQRLGAHVVGELAAVNVLIAQASGGAIDALSEADPVLWIELALGPEEPQNAEARSHMKVDALQDAPYNLDGSGINLLVYDVGRADHDDLNSRIIDQDTSPIHDHSTHVAGTAVGDGTVQFSQRGMAPAAKLITYGQECDGSNCDFDEDLGNAVDLDVDVATVSMGINVASADDLNCSLEGDYTVGSEFNDNAVRGYFARPLIMTRSNGNERSPNTDPPHRCGDAYATTPPPATAKNPITVGATNENNDNSSDFSSWGPTDDGRLKPIVSAPGVNVLSTIPDGVFVDEYDFLDCDGSGDDLCYPYDTLQGTSMSAPAVAGVVALMLQQFRTSYNTFERLLPSTVKAILINTTDDPEDPTDGPDFRIGYGRVNAQAAVDTIRENRFDEGFFFAPNDEPDIYHVNIAASNGKPLQISIAWDDAPGTPMAGMQLVNDLDLRLIEPDGTTVWRPWVLDPNNPANAPTRGIDSLNNQEQVTVPDPAPGLWTIEVSIAAMPSGPQDYGIAFSHNPGGFDIRYPRPDAVADAGYYAGPSTFQIHLDVSDGFKPSQDLLQTLDEPDSLKIFVGDKQIDTGTGEGEGAVILRGPVGNQYWLTVRAPGQNADDFVGQDFVLYPITVEFLGIATKTNVEAVRYSAMPAPPEALSVILDTSGSMAMHEKLPAAQNAGRNFIYGTNDGDGVATVHFSTGAATVDSLTDITGDPDRDGLADKLDELGAKGRTAIGQGLQLGYDEIKNDSREVKAMVLLSDGMENEAPLWKNMRDNIPVGVTVDTVAFGPDADLKLMAQIAAYHIGIFHEVPTGDGATTLAAPLAADEAPATVPHSATAITADVSLATEVQNRLADVYQFISDHLRDYQRLFEAAGNLNNGGSTILNVPLNESTPFLFFTVNWADPAVDLTFDLRRPNGNLVSPSDADVDLRVDSASGGRTSRRYRVTAPAVGTWKMEISNTSGSGTEFLATVAGQVDTDLGIFTPHVGYCLPDIPEKVCVSLHDQDGVIANAKITQLNVLFNHQSEVVLTDPDGDGVFCTDPTNFPEGATTVKVDAIGKNRLGQSIRRIGRVSFYCGDLDRPPILLVNDVAGDRDGDVVYFPVRDQYVAALDALGAEYDICNTDIDGSPSAALLKEYSKVIWFTADEIAKPGAADGPLTPDEEANVQAYLEHHQGNIFAFSSQGYLTSFGLTAFGSNVLGLTGYTDNGAGTTLRGVRGSPLGHEFGTYTYSPLYAPAPEALRPAGDAAVNAVDAAGEVTAVTHGYGLGCSAFFSFGLDGLPTAAFEEMLQRILDWRCAPVDVQTTLGPQDVSVHYSDTYTETFYITNPLVGGLRVEINNGPTHVWLLTDASGGVPTLLAPYHLGDLPSPQVAPSDATDAAPPGSSQIAAATAAGPLSPDAVVSRLCEMGVGLGDCFRSGGYTEADLLDNDVVVIWNDVAFPDPTGLGNLLADFVDLGGTVLLGGRAIIDGEIGGRWKAEGYSPLRSQGTGQGFATLSTITDPADPLFAGVGAITTLDHRDALPASRVHVHARWSDGAVLAASRSFQPGLRPQVIAVNASFEDGDWANDLHVLVANALGMLDRQWRSPGWFRYVCAVPGEFIAGDAIPPIVSDTGISCPEVEGGVDWQASLYLDSRFAPSSSLDLDAPPRYRGKLTLDTSAMGRARTNVPLALEVLCPAGDADCDLTVTVADLTELATYVGEVVFPDWADVDGDNDVDADDLALASANWHNTFP